jgi:hypothetical protein
MAKSHFVKENVLIEWVFNKSFLSWFRLAYSLLKEDSLNNNSPGILWAEAAGRLLQIKGCVLSIGFPIGMDR